MMFFVFESKFLHLTLELILNSHPFKSKICIMNPAFRNVLSIVLGIVIGSIINLAILKVSGNIIPPPDGADTTTTEGLKASIHLFQPKHFVFPFLAHAIGTLSGAFIAALIAAYNKMTMAMGIGVFFFVGGIATIFMLPSPMWFNMLDILLAYFPMAYLGAKLGMKW